MSTVYYNVEAELSTGENDSFILAVAIKDLGNNQLQVITDREGCLHEDSLDDPFDLENTTLTFINTGTGYTFSRDEELKFTFYDDADDVVSYEDLDVDNIRDYIIRVAKITGSSFYINEALLTPLPEDAKVIFDNERYVLSD